MNNGLGVLMLESLLKVSSKRNQGTQVGGWLRGRVESINGRKRVYGEYLVSFKEGWQTRAFRPSARDSLDSRPTEGCIREPASTYFE